MKNESWIKFAGKAYADRLLKKLGTTTQVSAYLGRKGYTLTQIKFMLNLRGEN